MRASLHLHFYELLKMKDVFRDACIGIRVKQIVVVAVFSHRNPMPIAEAHHILQRIPLDPSVDQIPYSLLIFILHFSTNPQFSSSQPSAIHPHTPQNLNNDINIVISAIVPIILFRLFLEASTDLFQHLGVDLLTPYEIVYRAFAVTAE